MGTVAALGAIVVVAYLISLRRHPRGRRCFSCKGTGLHRGVVFRYATRPCTRCGGNGSRARIGLRVMKPGQVWGERVPAEAAAKRGKNWGR